MVSSLISARAAAASTAVVSRRIVLMVMPSVELPHSSATAADSTNENLPARTTLLQRHAVQLLEPPDVHQLSAAIGWLELGNAVESEAELRQLSAPAADHPDALEVWFALHAHRRDWPAALPVAERLVTVAPERASGWLHRAYALRRVPGGGLQAAWDALLPASKMFRSELTIPYNLACYSCQLGRIEEAWKWFRKAIRKREQERIVAMALADPDLEPLHRRIAETYDDIPF